MPHGPTIEELNSVAELDAAGELWREIFDDGRRCSPFLSHEWYRSCVDAYGAGKRLLVLVVRRGAEVLAIAPLWVGEARLRGVSIARLEPIGCPDTPFVDSTGRAATRGTCST
jgi:hypothetical protein